jgi:hypothetical protein
MHVQRSVMVVQHCCLVDISLSNLCPISPVQKAYIESEWCSGGGSVIQARVLGYQSHMPYAMAL